MICITPPSKNIGLVPFYLKVNEKLFFHYNIINFYKDYC